MKTCQASAQVMDSYQVVGGKPFSDRRFGTLKKISEFGSVVSGIFGIQIQTSGSKVDFKNNPLLGRNLHKYDSYDT